ncbi:MAG: DUF4406 domain-containing protein [Bacteroidales bacterium]|nr:DUF4406 domain-containing protein [Bacteroidales bacterium]
MTLLQQKMADSNARRLAKSPSKKPNRIGTFVYVAGVVGDLTDDTYYYEVLRKFAKRERQLRKLGYSVINPMTLVKRGTPWHEAMKKCIIAMCKCSFISPLPDVTKSKGAMIEMQLAEHLKITILIPSKIN